jgi:hypothetical protein
MEFIVRSGILEGVEVLSSVHIFLVPACLVHLRGAFGSDLSSESIVGLSLVFLIDSCITSSS